LLAAGGDVNSDFLISPDSSRVVYWADQQVDDIYELYSVPLAGPHSAGVKLNGALVAGGNIFCEGYQISPDSSRVVYLADQQTDEVFELYSVPLAGPASSGVKLNRALVAGGDVKDTFQVGPHSSRVVYLADQQIDERWELYSAPLNGPAEAGIKLNPELAPGRDVENFRISPYSNRVIYQADQDTSNIIELYMVWEPILYLPLVVK